MIRDNVASVIGTLTLVSVATAIVYWRNRGSLSVRHSYTRAMLHYFRVFGWMLLVIGSLFTAPSVAALLGAELGGNWPWWSTFIFLACVGVGYGLQRLMRFPLNDPDLRNMFNR